DNGGNVRDGASTGCPGITDLVTSASCVGLDLQVVIADGDGAFDITASSGGGLPLISVATGTHLISGTGIWTNVQVSENGGDNQTDSLGDFNCSTPLVVNHACNGLDYEITVVSGDGTVNITGTGTGLPLNNVAIPNTYTLSAPGPWTGVTVTETAGNTEVFNIGDVSCTTALNATLSCVGNDLVVDILGGDGAFNINGTGNGLPLSAVVANTYTFTGPGSWTGVSVVELGGDAEFTAPADFNCFTPVALNASAVCIGDALQVTISGGNGNFNITSTTGTGLPLNNVIADVYTLTGPAAWTGVTVTELSGDLESTNLGDFTCQIPLMASAMCDANGDLTISIGNGDANFTITGTGFGLPIASSGTGSFTIDADALGVNVWTGVTITEIGFNGESVNLGDFNCNVPLAVSAVCNGVNLDVTLTSGDVSFNITDGATPLQSGVGLGVTTLTGPVVVTNLTITETGGDGQNINLGAYNCSNALNANVTCVGDDLVVTIVSGDTPFNINGSGAGLPLSGVATGSYTLTGPNVWTGVSVVEVGGDTQSINFGDFTCQTPLVASAMCVNGSLDVTITGGDANFNITGTGASLPMNNVGVGVHTLTEDALGVNSWTGVTVSEIGFNGESIVLGDFNCNVPLNIGAFCNGSDLDITVTSGDATFNFTADSGPLGNLGGLATFTITGPVTENNVTVTETSGDMQAINLGNFNCSSDLAATATCDVNGDLAITITAGDGAIFDITGTGNGMPTTGGMGINTFFGNNQGPNAWTGVIVSELSGDFDILNLGDTICNRPLNVTAVCLGDNLQVTINAGDASFDIADGVTALPAGTGVGLGTITFTGPINVADLTITEATGDTQNISLGAFNCFVSNALTATATCNGSDLDITISNGNAPFTINVTDSVGVMSFTGQPLGVYNFTGPDTFSNISVVEEGGDLETLVLADVTCPLPVPVAPVAVVLPPDPNALGCAITTEVNIPLAPDNTYCRVLMRDNGVVGYAGAVPQELINLGVIFAVDVYRLNGGQYVTTFPDYTRICLNGAGRLFYMDSRNSPRGIIELSTETEGNLTCGWIPAPGTLILTS
ncbi:MAG: hypothetical protein KJ043_08120, partial [Anaerolineae bacterium]|nr:hypothetical protein [Anaerolineae bacterium]